MDKNKRFAELAGICWHDITPPDIGTLMYRCACGDTFGMPMDAIRHQNKANPDFTDAREVVDVMENHPKGKLFFASLIYESNYEAIDDDGYIPRELVRDRTGKLRDLAIEWMKGKEAGDE